MSCFLLHFNAIEPSHLYTSEMNGLFVPDESTGHSLTKQFSSLVIVDSGSFSHDRALPSQSLRLSILKLDASSFRT